MSVSPDNRYAIKSVIKSFTVLEALSRAGESSTADIAQRVGLPRPTAHRLLETLCATGYVIRGDVGGTYRLSVKIGELAHGCRDDDWIAELSRPILLDLYHTAVWPSDVATYDNGAMVIRATTHHMSPLSIQRVPFGHRVPLLVTATGLTYLAYVTDQERDAILDVLARENPGALLDRTRRQLLLRELHNIRERGYGIRIRGDKPKTSTLAAPIMHHQRVVACVNIHWIDSAIELNAMIERYLEPLLQAATAIGVAYQNHLPTRRMPASASLAD